MRISNLSSYVFIGFMEPWIFIDLYKFQYLQLENLWSLDWRKNMSPDDSYIENLLWIRETNWYFERTYIESHEWDVKQIWCRSSMKNILNELNISPELPPSTIGNHWLQFSWYTSPEPAAKFCGILSLFIHNSDCDQCGPCVQSRKISDTSFCWPQHEPPIKKHIIFWHRYWETGTIMMAISVNLK